jgi:hypothetical protein
MSKVGYVFGYLLVMFTVVAAVLSVFALALGWLAPIATSGAFAPDFIQSLGIVTLVAMLAGFFRGSK